MNTSRRSIHRLNPILDGTPGSDALEFDKQLEDEYITCFEPAWASSRAAATR